MNLKRLSLFIVYIFITMHCVAQAGITDSLRKVLALSKNDTNKVNILLSLSKNSLSMVPETSLMYANDAHKLAAELKFTRGRALARKKRSAKYSITAAWFRP